MWPIHAACGSRQVTLVFLACASFRNPRRPAGFQECCCRHAFNFDTVSPSTPAAPLFRMTRRRSPQVVTCNHGLHLTQPFRFRLPMRRRADLGTRYSHHDIQSSRSFSGFAVARDTLAVQSTIPRIGRVENYHLQVNAPCRAHQKEKTHDFGSRVSCLLGFPIWKWIFVPE